MNWFKRANAEVQVLRHGPEGLVVVCDGKRYRCPGYNPLAHRQLEALIRARAWGKAKQMLQKMKCVNEQKERQEAANPQLQLF